MSIPFAFAKITIPHVMIVAVNQLREDFSRVRRNATIPVSAGADPRGVTVPIATPVFLTADKSGATDNDQGLVTFALPRFLRHSGKRAFRGLLRYPSFRPMFTFLAR